MKVVSQNVAQVVRYWVHLEQDILYIPSHMIISVLLFLSLESRPLQLISPARSGNIFNLSSGKRGFSQTDGVL